LVERLVDEVVSASFERVDFLLVTTRRNHDDWQEPRGWLRAESTAYFEAIQAGHDHIQQHQVRLVARDLCQGFLAGDAVATE
jgi:hypothetical protein